MDEVTIREYTRSDRAALITLMEQLQDYLIPLDPLHMLRRLPAYGQTYTHELFNHIRRAGGAMYLAEHHGEVVGLIAGIVKEQSTNDLLEQFPSRAGLVLELVVDERFRDRGIGAMLMERMEAYFVQAGCDISRIDVFAPNALARSFYQKLGYVERNVEVVKELR